LFLNSVFAQNKTVFNQKQAIDLAANPFFLSAKNYCFPAPQG